MSAEDFLKELIAAAEREVSYHKSEYENEVQRCKDKTAWVKALRQSLKEAK